MATEVQIGFWDAVISDDPDVEQDWSLVLAELPSIRELAQDILKRPKFKDLDGREAHRLAHNMLSLCDAIEQRVKR